MGAARSALPVRYGSIHGQFNPKKRKFLTQLTTTGSSSVSQREDSPAFSSQFDGMHIRMLNSSPKLFDVSAVGPTSLNTLYRPLGKGDPVVSTAIAEIRE